MGETESGKFSGEAVIKVKDMSCQRPHCDWSVGCI